MKKFLVYILAIVLAFGATIMPSVSADLSELIKVYRNKVILEVNGVGVNIDNFLYDGTTYIPLRAVSELLDKEVGWNTYTHVASINDQIFEKEKLSALLPDKVGYSWQYQGFAEYGHEAKLTKILDEAQKRTYLVQGEVGDPSDGESKLDFNINIKYIIEKNSLIQEKSEEAMLDSKFDRITLIKTPLEVGSFWPEKVLTTEGKEVLINSQIKKIEITDDGKKQYTIRYQDPKSDYYEERMIKEGTGVVSFEKLLELKDADFPVSYVLSMSGDQNGDQKEVGKKVTVSLYFPDKNAEKVHLVKREILMHESQIARGAIWALIEGTKEVNLTSAIPVGTKLLNIYLKNNICYVNFSKEFINNHHGGTAGESMTLASIVNTLTAFDSIDKVQILVEGKSGITLGHIVLDKPLSRMTDLIGD